MISRAYTPESDAQLWMHGETAATPSIPSRNLRDHLHPSDGILADKGTLIQSWLDSLRLGVKSTLPPFAHDGHLTDEEALRGKAISRRRFDSNIAVSFDSEV